ncbi:cbb3-type cytochrome oxidase subunit 3 [Bdellovibrio svalbardensis]|uniref:Cbb3-type cytochrome c oxidase subunit 3 n=1 Tax=Bdellovibrio svalbardensis TaxID=2972972 RepID=A0ABT6DGQ0_9BACT|nr:cbb3-type cytochrome c oxidase subunit 3 [Bdellovibrio svalbardensis]MDG0816015.1 cbb3-type cytochrome c oxidase subunit 3 [Bdellovibrio svalbardensis]
MKQLGLAAFTDTYLTALGLIIFFLFFIGMILWVNHKDRKVLYKQMENMPLNDGELAHERL